MKNFRPISLLPVTYKVFSQIILQRTLSSLEQHQLREQAGFRVGFSTTGMITFKFSFKTSYWRR